MSKSDGLCDLMDKFETRILDLETVSRLIRVANEATEELEVADKVMNLLVVADQLLSDQTDRLHEDFQVIREGLWYVEIETDYCVPIPDVVLKKLGWVEGDELEIEALEDKTISITKIQSS